MYTMSPAAIAPIAPHVSEQDRKHQRFADYEFYRQGCRKLLIAADSFRDWLRHQRDEEIRNQAAADPEYIHFLNWMCEHQGGARQCPAGAFPANFKFWKQGGRW